jgi:hypothetical protein
MKNALFLFLLSAFYFAGHAQTKGRNASSRSTSASGFSIGLEAGLPVGENGKIYSSLIGGSLQYEIRPDSDLGITANAGYLNYNIKSKYGGGSVGFVPLLAGVKYYFTPGAFFHAQLGAAIGTKSGQGTSFAYTPGIGFNLSRNFDAEIKYMGISNKGGTIPNVGVRVAYNL